jgi:hypothetical protein
VNLKNYINNSKNLSLNSNYISYYLNFPAGNYSDPPTSPKSPFSKEKNNLIMYPSEHLVPKRPAFYIETALPGSDEKVLHSCGEGRSGCAERQSRNQHADLYRSVRMLII